jgi:hypothetical protein
MLGFFIKKTRKQDSFLQILENIDVDLNLLVLSSTNCHMITLVASTTYKNCILL